MEHQEHPWMTSGLSCETLSTLECQDVADPRRRRLQETWAAALKALAGYIRFRFLPCERAGLQLVP